MDSTALPRQPPQEIFDIIIDDDSHDREMHKTFALVSTSFLIRSRRHFFRKITFSGYDKKDRAMRERFSEILNANPDIASYVREVHIRDTSFLVSADKERPSWIREKESFQGILLALAKNQITDLKLGADLDWTSFPTGLQHALTQILTAPSLVNLILTDVKNLPVSCCMHFPRIERFRIQYISLLESEDHQQREAATASIPLVTVTASISSLTLSSLKGKNAQLFGNILALGTTSYPSLPLLEKLKIIDCDPGFTQEVIRAARKSLRYLTLFLPKDAKVTNLSALESLNRLELGVNSDTDYQAYILGTLETADPNKEYHTIHITFVLGRSHGDWEEYLWHLHAAAFWPRLATFFDRFASVAHLVIHLWMWRYADKDLWEEQMAGFKDGVRDAFSRDGENSANVDRVLLVEVFER